jgi:hypothetical protein
MMSTVTADPPAPRDPVGATAGAGDAGHLVAGGDELADEGAAEGAGRAGNENTH